MVFGPAAAGVATADATTADNAAIASRATVAVLIVAGSNPFEL
jgi:hypothetical protein